MRSLRGFSDPFLAEIAGQPDAMRRAAASLVDQRDELDRIREAASASPTIVFTGMGSSYDACYPAVNDLAGRGVPSLLVDTAELLHFRRPILNARTLTVIVSQSGESAEIVKLASEISKQRLRPFDLDHERARQRPRARGRRHPRHMGRPGARAVDDDVRRRDGHALGHREAARGRQRRDGGRPDPILGTTMEEMGYLLALGADADKIRNAPRVALLRRVRNVVVVEANRSMRS